MAALAESVSERLIYKLYASSAIDSVTQPSKAIDPGADGGQVLRHTTQSLGLTKDAYRPSEKRDDAQQPMGKHGSRTISGAINGYLSPGTHKDLFAAVMRDAWSAPIELDETDLTSAAIDSTAKTITFGGGDPVALGLRVGMIGRFANLATPGNNGINVLIIGFSGSSNRVMSYYAPGLVTETADTGFVFRAGSVLVNKPTAAMRADYKFAFEVYNPGPDLSRFYSECKISGFDLSAGVNANVTLNFSVQGRNREILTGAAAPFFPAPAAETTTDIPTGMHGVFLKDGAVLGVTTGVNIKVDLGAEAAKAVNPEGLIAGISLGDFALTGDFTAFLTDGTLLSSYDKEEEFSLLLYFPEDTSFDAAANTFFMPRIKINSNSESDVNKAKAIQCQFEAGRYVGSAPGVTSTTLQICDSTVAS